MDATDFDPGRYKAAQQADWDSAAAAWRHWWPVIEEGTEQVTRRICELAGLRAGDTVLDVATGVGEPALTAARLVGPSGRVVATDLSAGMLGIARDRAAEAGLDHVGFVQTDAETLDVPPIGFDAVLCRFGLMFFPDLPAMLARVRALLVPGGRFAAATWAAPDRTPLMTVPITTIRRELGLPEPPADGPGVHALSDPARIQRLLRDAGFNDVHTTTGTVAPVLPSARRFVDYLRDVATPVAQLLGGQPVGRQDEIWAAVTDAVAAHAGRDGSVRLPAEAIVVTAGRG